MNNFLLAIPKPARSSLRVKLLSRLKLPRLFLLGICFVLILVAVYIFQINKFMSEKQQLESWQRSINELSDSNKELEVRLANLIHIEDEISRINELGLERIDKFNYLQATEQAVARKQP